MLSYCGTHQSSGRNQLDSRPTVFKCENPSVDGKDGGGQHNNQKNERHTERTANTNAVQLVLHSRNRVNDSNTPCSNSQHPQDDAYNPRQHVHLTGNPTIHPFNATPTQMESNNYTHQTRQHSGDAQKSSVLHHQRAIHSDERVNHMENYDERSNLQRECRNTSPSRTYDDRAPLPAYQQQHRHGDEGMPRTQLADSRTNRRHPSTHAEKYCGAGRRSNDGEIHPRENGTPRSIHNRHTPHHPNNERVSPTSTQQPMPFPNHHHHQLQRRSTENQYPVRVPFNQTWEVTSIIPRGDVGGSPVTHFPTPEYCQSTAISRLWATQWGKPTSCPNSSKGLRSRLAANAAALEFLQPNGGGGCPSAEDIQRAFPTMVGWRRTAWPIKPKQVRECKWGIIIEQATKHQHHPRKNLHTISTRCEHVPTTCESEQPNHRQQHSTQPRRRTTLIQHMDSDNPRRNKMHSLHLQSPRTTQRSLQSGACVQS